MYESAQCDFGPILASISKVSRLFYNNLLAGVERAGGGSKGEGEKQNRDLQTHPSRGRCRSSFMAPGNARLGLYFLCGDILAPRAGGRGRAGGVSHAARPGNIFLAAGRASAPDRSPPSSSWLNGAIYAGTDPFRF